MAVDPNIDNADPSLVANAGIRKTPIVTKTTPTTQRSFADELEQSVPEEVTAPATFGQEIEQIEGYQERTYKLGTGGINTDRYVGSVLGSVNAQRIGSSVYDEIDKKIDDIGNDPDVATTISEEIGGLADENVRNSLAAVYSTSPDDIQYVYDNLKKWRLQYGPGAFEKVTQDELAGQLALKSKEGNAIAQNRILSKYGLSLMAKRMDETSTADKIWDFAKLVVLPGTTIAMGDYLEKFNPSALTSTTNFAKELFGRVGDLAIRGQGFKAYQATVREYWNKPTEEQLQIFDDIEDHIHDVAGGNIFVYTSMMEPFINKESMNELKLFYDLDSLVVSAYGAGKASKLVKTLAAIRNSRKPIQILVENGQVEKASEIINRALADPNANRMKKVTGMDYDDVAASANALDTTRANPEQIQGAAAAAAEALEKEALARIQSVDKAFVEALDPALTPRRFYFDEAAKMELQRKALAGNNDYTNYAEIIERTDDGFVMEVTRSNDKYFLPSIINPRKYDLKTRQASNRVLEIQRKDKQSNVDRANQAVNDIPDYLAKEKDNPYVKGLIDDASRANDDLAIIDNKIADNNQVIKALTDPAKVDKVIVKYGFDEQGNFQATEIGRGVVTKLNSPEQTVGQLSATQVGDNTLAEFTEAKIFNTLSEASRTVYRGLTPAGRKNIDQVLQWGDEMGRTYSIPELVGGIDTRFGRVQLKSTNEIASYLSARRYYDNLHRVENYLRRRNLEVGGFKELSTKLTTADGQVIKVFAKRETATIPDGVRRIYDHKAGKVIDVGDGKSIEYSLQNGDAIVNFRQGVKVKTELGDEIITYGIVNEGKDLRSISGKVLNYRNGYVPKVRPNVAYVAIRTKDALVNGVKAARQETVRFFDNVDDANKWRLAQGPEAAAEMKILPDKQFRNSSGGDFTSEFDNLNFGGLYTGERTDRSILQGLDGVEAQRVSAYKTMQMYANHVASKYSTNELKMNLIGKFQNSFGDFLQNPGNWRSPLKAEFENNLTIKKTVEAQRAYINDLIKTPDMYQQWYADRMRGIAETMALSKVTRGGSGWVMRLGTKDPIGAVRTLTFHQYLGFFNPSQLLVQGFGAATAVAAYPLKAAKLLPKNLALRAVWWDRANPGMISRVANMAGLKSAELTDIVKEIERLGIFDNLKSTADFGAAANGVTLTGDALKRMANAGLVFLREGEMTARGYGYLLARDLFLSAKPKGYKLTDKDLDAIGRDSTRFTMNLNRANRAWWQKGVLSIPTQFWQITAKFTEAMVGGSFGLGVRKWSPAEKAKILVGYLAMFGAGGVPFGESMIADAMNAYKQSTDDPTAMSNERINPFNNLPPELRVDDGTFARFIKGGLTQVMANWLTGGDPKLTQRVSIPAGVVESIEMFGSTDSDTIKLIGGAALPGLGRWADAFGGLFDIWAPGKELDLTDEEWRQAVVEVAGILSSTRNASKALWWDKIGYIENKGKRMFPDMENDEFNSLTVWQSLGFSPAKIGWAYDLEEADKGFTDKVKERVQQAYDLTLKYAPTGEMLRSEKNKQAINARINLLIADLTDSEREKFYKQLVEKELASDSKITERTLEAVTKEAEANGEVTPGMLANPLLSR